MGSSSKDSKTMNNNMEKPPDDDVCPVCFGDFTLPCRTNCGHWFCGNCILQVWNHGSALRPCKCPLCCSDIKSLTPPITSCQHNEKEAKTILKTVEKYNRLYVGGIHGFMLKIRETPLLTRRLLWELMDPDQADSNFLKLRVFSLILGLLYLISPFNFIHSGADIVNICNSLTVLLVGFLKLVAFYRRRRSAFHVRQISAAEIAVSEHAV